MPLIHTTKPLRDAREHDAQFSDCSAVLDRAVALQRHGLVEPDVEERVAGFQRDGVGELKRCAIHFAASLADDVVRATDVMDGINAADLPPAFLRAAVIVAENLIEPERVAAPPPATFGGKTLAALSGVFANTPEERVRPEKNCSGRKRVSAAAASGAELMSSAASKMQRLERVMHFGAGRVRSLRPRVLGAVSATLLNDL